MPLLLFPLHLFDKKLSNPTEIEFRLCSLCSVYTKVEKLNSKVFWCKTFLYISNFYKYPRSNFCIFL